MRNRCAARLNPVCDAVPADLFVRNAARILRPRQYESGRAAAFTQSYGSFSRGNTLRRKQPNDRALTGSCWGIQRQLNANRVLGQNGANFGLVDGDRFSL